MKLTENKIWKLVRRNALVALILISILVGFIIGIILKNTEWGSPHGEARLWFTLPGMLFIRSLELFSIPVVLFGVMTATSSMSLNTHLRMTLISMALCVGKNLMGTLTGLLGSFVMIALTPTSVIEQSLLNKTGRPTSFGKQKTVYDIVSDILRNLIPRNIVRAAVSQELTIYVPVYENNTVVDYTRKVEFVNGSNVLGILIFG